MNPANTFVGVVTVILSLMLAGLALDCWKELRAWYLGRKGRPHV